MSDIRRAIDKGNIEMILALFEEDEVDKRDGYWMVLCPGHEEHTPSCSVTVGDTGKVVLRDHSATACEFEEMVAGLEARENGTNHRVLEDVAALASEYRKARTFKRTWEYAGSDGNTYTKYRIGRGKGHREWWDPKRPAGVTVTLRETTPLEDVPQDAQIDLPDGEIDADAIHEEGGYAVTCGSLSQFTEEHAERLAGRRVRVHADRDGGKGASQARSVIRFLRRHGCEVQVVEAKAGKDAEEHLKAGYTLDDFLPAWYVTTPQASWETSLPDIDAEAFHGIAGEFAQMIDPYTEADKRAILIQTLIAFGNTVSRRPHVLIGAERHGTNEYALIAGESSAARKGTGAREVMQLLESVAPDWCVENIVHGGLVSGEALVSRVANRTELVREQEGETVKVTVHEEHDGRLLVLEEEFAAILAVLQRYQQTLGSMLRKGWDGRPIENLSLANPFVATDHHISVIAHVTQQELRERLTSLDMANGFANRFLFAHSTRSKFLPEPGRPPASEYAALVRKFKSAYEDARQRGEVRKAKEAREYWGEELYLELEMTRYGGMMDALTARRSPHVQRLALVYALLDGEGEIRVEHLKAARAVWRYSEATCRYLFSDATGNRDADTILDALRAHDEGMSRLDLTNLFQRNRTKKQIDAAVTVLLHLSLAEEVTEARATRGRPATRLYAL